MKKHIFLLVLGIFYLSTLNAADFKEGYYTLEDGTTKEVFIRLTNNKISFIRYLKKGKVKKIRKSSLVDFGFIKNGQKESKYAEYAFPEKAYRAYYIENDNKDTIHFYFTANIQNEIEGYNLDRTELYLSPEEVDEVVVEMGTKTAILDIVTIKFKRNKTKTYFLERKTGSRVNMYTITIKKYELKDLDEPYYIYHDGYATKVTKEIKAQYYFMHLLVKGDRKLLLAFGTKDKMSELEVRSYINDCAFINSKLGTKGYQIENDLFTIIKTYNQRSSNNECN